MIPFHDTVLIAGEPVLNQETGDMEVGAFILTQAKLSYESEEVTDYNGQQTASAIKIYLPHTTQVTEKSKLIIGEKTYKIKKLAPKNFLNGRLAYVLCYV